jgi:DNA-binding HxlR family transcriptional regulator
LTLMFVGGSLPREGLLAILERSMAGGLLGPVDAELLEEAHRAAYEEFEDDEPEEDEDYDEEDYEDEDEDAGDLLEALPPVLRQSQGQIGPHTRLQTTSKGEEFLFVAYAMERWLRNRPEGALELGPAAGEPLSALVCCWSATVTHALAPEALTLDELDRAVGILEREVVEEHLEAMVRSGLAHALAGPGETRYGLTDWGREGISPIVAAVRYECHYPEADVLPPDVFDAEAAFQMALPLVRLPPALRGSCRLGVRITDEETLVAGASVEVDRGAVLAASPLLDENPDTWATGTPLEWCETVVDPAAAQLEVGGETELTGALIQALHEKLFGSLELS